MQTGEDPSPESDTEANVLEMKKAILHLVQHALYSSSGRQLRQPGDMLGSRRF